MIDRVAALGAVLWMLAAQTAQGECIAYVEPNPVVRLKSSKYVYFAQVTAVSPDLAEVKVIRSWRGSKRTFSWKYSGARIGQYYLAFGHSDPEIFDPECGIMPIPLDRAMRQVTLLDRYRGFPRLVVPSVKYDEE